MNGNIQELDTREFSCILENTPFLRNNQAVIDHLVDQFCSLREDESEISYDEIAKYLFSLSNIYSKINLFERISLANLELA